MSRKHTPKTTKPNSSRDRREVEFRYESMEAKEVHLAGGFNQWNSHTMPMLRDERGVWRARVPLPPGRYEYRFIVDGDWRNDACACGVIPNAFGSCNCVVEVRS